VGGGGWGGTLPGRGVLRPGGKTRPTLRTRRGEVIPQGNANQYRRDRRPSKGIGKERQNKLDAREEQRTSRAMAFKEEVQREYQ